MKFDIRELAKTVRLDVVNMVNKGSSSHVGSALSCVDIIISAYTSFLNCDPKNPESQERDIFILSKGHAGAALYATLANLGFFPKDLLDRHYQNDSEMSGHVSHKLPGIEVSTGALGHGLPVGVGWAKGLKLKGSNRKVCVLLSDGECDEGSNWEAAMFASHHKLNNLVAVIDYNKLQSLGSVSDTLALEPFKDKWEAFGWDCLEIDGHDYSKIAQAFEKVGSSKKPICMIAHTTKGKGISFMENQVLWHYRAPKGDEFDAAIKELEAL